MSETQTSASSSPQATPAERLAEAEPLSRVQTDLFCRGCGESLYHQPVWRTEQTGLLVATCPRCAVTNSAAESLPYRRAWQQRLGVVLSLVWLSVLGGLLALFMTLQGALQNATVYISYDSSYHPSIVSSTTRSATPPSYAYQYSTVLHEERSRQALMWVLPLSVLVSLAAGGLLACALYHWRWWWHAVAATAMPLVPLWVVWWEFDERVRDRVYDLPMDLVAAFLWFVATIQIASGVVGVLVGRPVTRGLLRVLLPRNTRKYFAFLWHRDGKQLL